MKSTRRCPDCCRIVLTGGPGGGKTTAADLFVTIYIAPCLFCAVEERKWKKSQRLAGGPEIPGKGKAI